MNPEVKQKWVEALRSGKYKQGKGRLRKGNKFCCLGVLCEISIFDYSHSDEGLPFEVREWAGIKDCLPSIHTSDGFRELAILNDGKGYGFKRLANLIEKYL